MKRLIRMAAIAAGILVAAIAALVFYLDGIARTAIERGSTHALGVETTVRSVSIGLLGGSIRVAGLEIANPPGFEDPRFLAVGEARMDLAMGTLQKQTVVVPHFGIHGIEVDLDKERGKANYEVILDNLARSESEEPEPTPEADEGAGKRFVLQELVIRDLVAHVRVVERGGIPQVDVVVPEVRVRNPGGGQSLTAGQVTNVIVKAVLASIAKAGADLPGGVASALSSGLGRLSSVSVDLPDGGKLSDSAGDAVSGGVDAAGDAVDAGTDAAGDAVDAGKDAAKGAGKKLKGLGGRLLGDD